jgi:hypothetical protein
LVTYTALLKNCRKTVLLPNNPLQIAWTIVLPLTIWDGGWH